jgi:hypothetical protein
MRLVIDLDGVICEEQPTFERAMAKPKPGAVEAINRLYDKGHNITVYTARGWREYPMTKWWLETWGIKHHLLLCGKPVYDYWIDDRAMEFENWETICLNLGETTYNP